MHSTQQLSNITDIRARQKKKEADFDAHVDQVTQDLYCGIRAAMLLIRTTRAAAGLPPLPELPP